jgi:hypothetical protein
VILLREGDRVTHRADRPPLDDPPQYTVEIETRMLYERIVQFSSDHLAGQAIPPLAALIGRIEERRRLLGETAEQATQVVVQDLEGAASSIHWRTVPLMTICGLVVAVAGVLDKFTPDPPVLLTLSAIFLAVVGLYFTVVTIFTHAGRRAVGLQPTQEDVAYARVRLVKKDANSQIGTALTTLAVIMLIAVILTS